MIPSRAPALPVPRRHFLGRMLAAAAGAWLLRREGSAEANVQGDLPYLGEINLFAGNFAPNGWALCNGQLLPIAQNQALFSLLGTTYGGDGQVTFRLPDLRGRVAIHRGQGPGLSPRSLGAWGGLESWALNPEELPVHTHIVRCSAATANVANPAGLVPARNAASIPQWGTTVDATMGAGAIMPTGGGQAHQNMQPYLVLNYIIALQGIFPSR